MNEIKNNLELKFFHQLPKSEQFNALEKCQTATEFYDLLQKVDFEISKKIYTYVWYASGCPKEDPCFSENLLKKDISILQNERASLTGGKKPRTLLAQVKKEILSKERKIQFFKNELEKPIQQTSHKQLKTLFSLMPLDVQCSLKEEGISPPFYGRGFNPKLYETLGAHYKDGVTLFSLYAPNARDVHLCLSAFGSTEHDLPMERGNDGIWKLQTKLAPPGRSYHYQITTQQEKKHYKVDPFSFQNLVYGKKVGNSSTVTYQKVPESVVIKPTDFIWSDKNWIENRVKWCFSKSPLSIYEVHPLTWKLDSNQQPLKWKDLAVSLANYCNTIGYNAIELMALFSHPQPISMGYQITNFFAPNNEMGTWEDFQYFVNYMHGMKIAVFADWVPAHFANDYYSLIKFDGSSIFEDDDHRFASHPTWGTMTFDFKKQFTRDFLASNADFLCNKLHLDGLRVDAVSSMLFLNFDQPFSLHRKNHKGTDINIDAQNFLRNLNPYLKKNYNVWLMAEESTGFPNLTSSPFEKRYDWRYQRPQYGMGFDMTWHMGFMNDTLKALEEQNFDLLDTTMQRIDGDNHIRPRGSVVIAFSHDESANGKKTILTKFTDRFGDQTGFKMGNFLLAYQLLRGGGAILDFMGNEILQRHEWHGTLIHNLCHPEKTQPTFDWNAIPYYLHKGAQNSRKDLNHLWHKNPGLWDQTETGFSWICSDKIHNVLGFYRTGEKQRFICIFNASNKKINSYHLQLPISFQSLKVVYHSDKSEYGGNDQAKLLSCDSKTSKAELVLPPLTAMVLEQK